MNLIINRISNSVRARDTIAIGRGIYKVLENASRNKVKNHTLWKEDNIE